MEQMRISESCYACLYDKQRQRTDDPVYLARVKDLLDNRDENDTSPYMVYCFNNVFTELYGRTDDYSEIKKTYNDLVLGMEDQIRKEIESSSDPVAKALVMARIGNYIDFGAMNHVNNDTFLGLFRNTELSRKDMETYESFLKACTEGRNFLLVCDNCGEIVLDKLLIEQLSRRFPHLSFTALVRGGDVLNDATVEDAQYVGLDRAAKIVPSGVAAAGTLFPLLCEEAKRAFDEADVILSKGQGNYESVSGQGFHVFYALLCKCDLFTKRFNVPFLTGIFVEEE